MHDQTFLIRNQHPRSENREHSVPIYFTSSYVFDNADHMAALFADEQEGFIYSRYANPNVSELIQKVAKLEHCESGWATASGMAAIFCTFGAFLNAGDEIISSRSVFGSTHKLFTQIFPKWGIKTTYVEGNSIEDWAQAITPNTKMLYLETPTNPAVDIIDMQKAADFAKAHKLLYVVDNCFATPINQRPADFGADLVIHSATKFMDGQGRAMGGLILGKKEHIKQIEGFARHTGPAISPFNAWILSKSLETLPIRMRQHNESAHQLTEYLLQNNKVTKVKYPLHTSHPQYAIASKQMLGGGGVLSFELKEGLNAGKRFLNQLQMFSLTANLGDSRSIATHPASTTHSKLSEEDRQKVGITSGLIRVSVGLEHVDDIISDIDQALALA